MAPTRPSVLADMRSVQSSRAPVLSKKGRKKQAKSEVLSISPFNDPGKERLRSWSKVFAGLIKDDPELALAVLASINPFLYKSRLLDLYQPTTAIYGMRRYIDIPIDPSGRWGIVVVPKLGSIAIGDDGYYHNYQLYVAQSGATAWNSGLWNDPTQFVSVSQGQGDIRVDPNLELMTTGVLQQGGYYSTDLNATQIRSFNGQIFANLIGVVSPTNTLVTDLFAGAVTFSAGVAETDNQMHINRPGVYHVTGCMGTDNAGAEGVLTVTASTGTVFDALTDAVFYGRTNVASAVTTVAVTGTNVVRTNNVKSSWDFQVLVPEGGGTLTWGWTSHAGNLNFLQMDVTAGVNSTVASGLAKTIRPTSAGLWVEWVGPMIENAGVISTCLSPGTGVYNLLAPSGTTQFRPFNYETYLQVQPGRDKRCYVEGRLDHGSYVTWESARPDDEALTSPNAWNTLNPPALCAAGIYSTTGTMPTGGILRAHIAINFEYETTSLTQDVTQNLRAYSDGLARIRNARQMLDVPIAMENDFHEFITRLAEGLLKVVEYNARLVGTAARAAGIKSIDLGPLSLKLGAMSV